jgi:hypothetical protein
MAALEMLHKNLIASLGGILEVPDGVTKSSATKHDARRDQSDELILHSIFYPRLNKIIPNI